MTRFLQNTNCLKEWKKRIEITQQWVDSGFSRETEPVGYIQEEIYYRLWFRQLWRLTNPIICACKLETQESWCCNSVRVWRPENWGWWWGVSEGQRCKSWSASECPKARSNDVRRHLSPSKECKFALPPSLCSIQTHNGLDDACPKLVRVIFFTQSAELTANLFQRHPHRHTQI